MKWFFYDMGPLIHLHASLYFYVSVSSILFAWNCRTGLIITADHKIMFSSQPHSSCDFCAQLRVSVAFGHKVVSDIFFFFFFLKIQAVVLLWHLNPHLVASALCILMRWWHCLKSSSFNLEVAFQPQMNIIWRCCFFPRLAQMERSNGSLPTDSSSATGSMWVPFARFCFFFFFYTVSLPEFLSPVSEHMHANIWTVFSPNARSYQSADNILLGREAPQPVVPAFRTSEQVKVSHVGRQKKKKGDDSMWLDKKKRTGV